MKPPYDITPAILNEIISIAEKLSAINISHLDRKPPELRRKNRIKTIQSSLGIEGNSLSLDQVTAIVDNKRVLGKESEVREVQNAIVVYDKIPLYKPFSVLSFCSAHGALMNGLIADPGVFRKTSVGIKKGEHVTHLAPSSEMVHPLIKDLFNYLKNDEDPLLIKSCVFHYKMEFIHPFSDGNGRMGRLWQTVLLYNSYPVFEYLPVESSIKEKQHDYYKTLSLSDSIGKSTPFIEFMLKTINNELASVLSGKNVYLTSEGRIEKAREKFAGREFTRKEYLWIFKEISPATASRDLLKGVENNVLLKKGDKRLTVYRFISPTSSR